MDNGEKDLLFQQAAESYQKAVDGMVESPCTVAFKRVETTEGNLLSSRIEEDQILVKADFTGDNTGFNIYIFPKDIFRILPQAEEEGSEELAMSALSELVSMMMGGFCAALKQKQVDLSYSAPQAELLDKTKLALPNTSLQLVNFTLTHQENELIWWQVVEEVWADSLMRHQQKSGQTSMQGVAFPQFDIAHLNPQEQKNLGLLMDVPMVVTVELGRTRWQLRDVLTIGEGSIIELDKQAGEQVDILVNNNLVARGEVVVVDENFSVRITEIISTIDQMMQRIE